MRDWLPIEHLTLWLPETLRGRAIFFLILFFPIISLFPIIITHSLTVMMLMILANLLLIPSLLWWAVKATARRTQPEKR